MINLIRRIRRKRVFGSVDEALETVFKKYNEGGTLLSISDPTEYKGHVEWRTGKVFLYFDISLEVFFQRQMGVDTEVVSLDDKKQKPFKVTIRRAFGYVEGKKNLYRRFYIDRDFGSEWWKLVYAYGRLHYLQRMRQHTFEDPSSPRIFSSREFLDEVRAVNEIIAEYKGKYTPI